MTKQKNITEYPTVSMNQAASIFMWSPRKFQVKFMQLLQLEIRHIKTSRGVRLLLEDVLRSAYPDAPEGKIYDLAYDYTMRDAARRKETWGNRKAKVEKEENNR